MDQEKIKEKEIRAEALREMAGGSPAADELKHLDEKLQLDDELAALKAKMAAPAADSNPPKLIASGEKNEEHKHQQSEDIVDVEPE